MSKTSPRTEKSRLQKFMLATPVAAAAVGAASSAQGAVVYFDVPDQVLTGPSNVVNFGNINLIGGTFDNSTAGNSFHVGWNSGDVEKPVVGTNLNIQISNDSTLAGSGASRYGPGVQIDSLSASSWVNGTCNLDSPVFVNGSWQNGAPIDGYAGLRISDGLGNYNYGWAALSYNDATNQLTITGFAFEANVNNPIAAGAIPEPADSVLMLAFGAAGVALYRRRRAVAA